MADDRLKRIAAEAAKVAARLADAAARIDALEAERADRNGWLGHRRDELADAIEKLGRRS